ncbi:PP2C family protein-serine/threonine phosphatase [Streptomyces sp. NPDC002835]
MASLEDSARMLRALLQQSHLAPFEELPGMVARCAGEAGLRDVRIFVVDMREEVLREATGRGRNAGEGGQELRIDTTLAGRVFCAVEPLSAPADGRVRHWLRVTIAATMEPAYATAGDAFDYALAGDTVHLAVFDAMGHDTSAGLTANLAMATCRNQRRRSKSLAETRDAIETMLTDQFAHTRYATAVLADLDLSTGLLSWINCGHHPPILIRDGRWTTHLECDPTHPLGTDLDLPATVCREQLEPGDRLLLYTDGVIEARDANGREFGRDHFVDFVIRHQAEGHAAPETLRRLVHAVLDHHDGRLTDDATVLLCEWHGPAAPTTAKDYAD